MFPFHQPGGPVGLISLAAGKLDHSPRELAAAKAIAVFGYLRAREICRAGEVIRHASPWPRLTPREVEVMTWIAAGRGDPEIAETLTISQATAHFHVENAKRKLGCTTRAQAAARAVYLGLVEP